MAEAYPLQWPEGFSRNKRRETSQFKHISLSKAMIEIEEGIRLLIGKKAIGENDLIVSTNMRRRKKDGGIFSNGKEPIDSGVAVYFPYQGIMRSIACDKWLTVKENMHSISKTIEAMRGIDRWGASDMLNRIFTGFIGIPEDAGLSWPSIIGVPPGSSLAKIRKAYKEKLKRGHPDTGGSEEETINLNNAFKKALQELT